jgi:hypothetical protein
MNNVLAMIRKKCWHDSLPMTDWLKMNVRRFQFSTDAKKRDFPFFLTLSLFSGTDEIFSPFEPVLPDGLVCFHTKNPNFGKILNGKCCYIL